MQNAVRQRLGNAADGQTALAAAKTGVAPTVQAARSRQKMASQNGAAAAQLKQVSLPEDADPRLAAALERLNRSRVTFAGSARPQTVVGQPAAVPPRPASAQTLAGRQEVNRAPALKVVSATAPASIAGTAAVASVPAARPLYTSANQAAAGPGLQPAPKVNRPPLIAVPPKKVDTNKLPAINEIISDTIDSFRKTPDSPADNLDSRQAEAELLEYEKNHRIRIPATSENEPSDADEVADDEIDDLAPVSLRFNSSLFDLIIGIGVTIALVAPFVGSGESWISLAGLATFTGILGVVLFLYLTVATAFFGKTAGMRLFELQVVDLEENTYPTIHQAAVSSALYLLTLLFLGLGFLAIFFDPERRALHDRASNTIVVKEF
jgi:uncharacterized RDD family membrane protein YckC